MESTPFFENNFCAKYKLKWEYFFKNIFQVKSPNNLKSTWNQVIQESLTPKYTALFITSTLADGQNVDEILLEFTKAFDLVPHNWLVHKLATYDIADGLKE